MVSVIVISDPLGWICSHLAGLANKETRGFSCFVLRENVTVIAQQTKQKFKHLSPVIAYFNGFCVI